MSFGHLIIPIKYIFAGIEGPQIKIKVSNSPSLLSFSRNYNRKNAMSLNPTTYVYEKRPPPSLSFSPEKPETGVILTNIPSPEMGLKDKYEMLLKYGLAIHGLDDHRSERHLAVNSVLYSCMTTLWHSIKAMENRDQQVRDQKQ